MKTIYICEIPHQGNPRVYDTDFDKLFNICLNKVQDLDEKHYETLDWCIDILYRNNSSIIYSENINEFRDSLEFYSDGNRHHAYLVYRAMKDYFGSDYNNEE
jgi:hypothetical protein